jgi:hypothetical protein
MKPKTRKLLRRYLFLINRKRAFFFEDAGKLYFTYPKQGWSI